jgi:hypothetical protein
MVIPNFNHEKLLSKIIIADNGCWNWVGYSHGGYGKMGVGKKDYMAHRMSYDLFVGINNLDNVIDHICMNKICINPDHLREVTVRTNTLENSNCDAVGKKQQTHCIKGHEFNELNTIFNIGKQGGLRRNCKACKRVTAREWARKNYHKRKDRQGKKNV